MSHSCTTLGLTLHRELPAAMVSLPKPSCLLSCVLSQSWRVTQLRSQTEIIPAAHAHKISLSIDIYTLTLTYTERNHPVATLSQNTGKRRDGENPMGNGGVEMDWHTQPQLSYIKMRLHSGELPGKRLLCDLPLHIIQHSEVCSVCTKHSKLFHISFIGFIPYCNERGKAIKLFPYKNQSLSSVLGQVHWHYNLTNIHQRGL